MLAKKLTDDTILSLNCRLTGPSCPQSMRLIQTTIDQGVNLNVTQQFTDDFARYTEATIFGTLAELQEIAATEYVHELGSCWGANANLSFGDALQKVIEDCEKRLKTIKAEAAAFYSRQRKI